MGGRMSGWVDGECTSAGAASVCKAKCPLLILRPGSLQDKPEGTVQLLAPADGCCSGGSN